MIISITRTIAIVSPFHLLSKKAVKVSCVVYAVVLVVLDAASMATGSIFVKYSIKGPFCIWTVEEDVFSLVSSK